MQEIMNKFENLYTQLKAHQEREDMLLWGAAFKELMQHTAQHQPQMAQKILDKLSAMEWDHYLTSEEAHKIYAALEPKAKWDYHTLMQHLKNLNLEYEEEDIYNSFALWITMSAIHSNHHKSICHLLKKQAHEITDVEIIPHLHMVAVEILKDKDGHFEVREFFDVD